MGQPMGGVKRGRERMGGVLVTSKEQAPDLIKP